MEWTEFEIKEHMAAGGEFDSGRIKYILNNSNKSHANPTAMNPATPATPTFGLTTPTTPAIRHTTNSTAEVTVPITPTIPSHTPTQHSTTERDFGKELTNLAKIYTDESKYTGQDDNFDFKLVIFHDLCGRASVPEEAKVKAYPTMLSNLALDHYYTNLRNIAQTLSFDQLCNATRNYFEGPEYKQSILSKWNSIILRSIMDSNTGKST